MYKAKIIITYRKSILDPQGKTIENSLHSLGFTKINNTRMGKYIEYEIDTNDTETAEQIVEETCKKLLANPVMEEYSYKLEKLE
ncbi:MAG: phosphoribosylformylglycinamidine synthase subunit PurS [Ignavibacteria bacterium]|nr:phosphoribosylformylglycinamidine synthase subunit PurS [Ignavibacteria bacterium]